MLFKQDLMMSEASMAKHFLPVVDARAEFTLFNHIEHIKTRDNRKDINVKSYVEHAKLIVTQILEHKNRVFVQELRKNRSKLVEMLYSRYSPWVDYVKKQKGGVALLDLVQFVQTNLLKLYVDQGNKKAIMNFFDSRDNRNCILADAKELQQFLGRRNDPEMLILIMALIHEHVEKDYVEALKKWKEMKSDLQLACLKTVTILKRLTNENKEMIFEYLEWVLKLNPEIGLSLFLDRNQQQTGVKTKRGTTIMKEEKSTGKASGDTKSVSA